MRTIYMLIFQHVDSKLARMFFFKEKKDLIKRILREYYQSEVSNKNVYLVNINTSDPV